MGPRPTTRQRQDAGAIAGLELFESDYRLEWMPEPWADVEAAGAWLTDLEARTRPELIHLNGFAHGALRWKAPKMVVGHSCVLSWWEAVHGQAAPSEWAKYREAVVRGLQAADLVVAPSRAMLSALIAHYDFGRPARVIPNGRRVQLAIAVDRPKEDLVLTAGRLWDQAKNLKCLAAIAPELPWRVCVAGETSQPGSDSNGRLPLATGNLEALGNLSSEDLAGWFQRASIFVLPAKYEPFGLSVLEAALCGCALVLGNIPSLRENWDGCALLVPPDSPAALKSAVQRLIEQPELRGELAAKARKRAGHLTPELMGTSYLKAYAQLLQRPELGASGSASAAVRPAKEHRRRAILCAS